MDTIDYVALFEQSQGLVPIDTSTLPLLRLLTILLRKLKPRVRALQARYFVVFLNPEDRTGDGESKIRALINHQNKTADTLPIVDTIFLNGIGRAGLNQNIGKS
jgi:hypothetical protein